MARRGGLLWASIGVAGLALALAVRSQRDPGPRREAAAPTPEPIAYYQAAAAEHPGAAIVVLVDTSGSMADLVPGSDRPKYLVAREALQNVLAATDALARRRPGYPIDVAIYGFSSFAWEALSMRPYDHDQVAQALARLPRPGGGTAIGVALQTARVALYTSGDIRKYILVVTDGQNTVGSAPDLVARDIFVKSRGGVSMSFVAFDTDPVKFGWVREVGGEVAAAQDGQSLQQALQRIYEGKILAELEPGEKDETGSAGQRPAGKPSGRAP